MLLALALPGVIFIFLKIFGKNRFDIPVYYKDGVTDAPGECRGAYHGQYTLPDSISVLLGQKNTAACLFVEGLEKNNKEVARLRKLYAGDKLQIISLDSTKTNHLVQIKKCALFLKAPWKAVLVDKENRIRGYYAFSSIEEADRLDVEVEILLTNQ